MLSNREIATLIIFGVVLVLLLSWPKTRTHTIRVFQALMHRRILLVLLVYLAYSSIVVWIAWKLGVWDARILKDTVIWVLFTGVPLVFRASEVKDGKILVRRTILETFAVSTVVALYLTLYSFSIPWEIVLQISLAFLAMLEVVARHQGDDARPAVNLLGFVIAAIAIFLIWRTGAWLVDNWSSLDHSAILMLFGMAGWLPLAVTPFIYILAVAIHWESVLTMLPFFNQRQKVKLRVKLGFILGTRFSAKYAGNFTGMWRGQLARAKTFREALDVMADYRRGLRNHSETPVDQRYS